MTRLRPSVGQSDVAARAGAPRVPFRELRALWFQITGTLCNLACRHCFNASGPGHPWFGSLDGTVVRRYIAEAEIVREGLPEEFAETIRTSWWTCCLESLPVRERARGRY